MNVIAPVRPREPYALLDKSQFNDKTSGLIPKGLCLTASLLIIGILLIILGNIVINGAGTISWKFLTSPPENGMESGGIFPAIFGTVALVILMTIAVIPVGVFTAIYLHEYTRPDAFLTRLIRLAVNNLAGVPSIVFGLFGLGFFVGFIWPGVDKIFSLVSGPTWGQPAIIWAALTLAILPLPVVTVAT